MPSSLLGFVLGALVVALVVGVGVVIFIVAALLALVLLPIALVLAIASRGLALFSGLGLGSRRGSDADDSSRGQIGSGRFSWGPHRAGRARAWRLGLFSGLGHRSDAEGRRNVRVRAPGGVDPRHHAATGNSAA
ncbi:MAG: hypothetical protein SFZ23_11890 [Planctomycetota bacterium]|nr:hypothetical protein [Planctomycetota bacterium]